MFTKRTLLTAVSLLTLAALLAACGATPTAQVIKETVPVEVTKEVTIVETVPVEVTKIVEATVETVVTPTPAPLSPEEQARAETLVVALDARIPDPTNFNIYTWQSPWWQGLQQGVYEFFFYDNLQSGEYIPWLAESYQYNADYTAITVKLREGVAWSDGEPFTADDVVFTYDLLLKNPSMAWAAETSKWVKTVEKVDDLTVTINLTSANPRYHLVREAFPAVGIWGAIYILPKHIWEGQDPLTFKNNPPIGTGPYKLVNATETALTYERRDDWWGTKVFGHTPAPKTTVYQYFGGETNTALALAANEVDFPYIGVLSLGSFKEVAARNPNVSAWYKEAPYD
jgi:peptide/nickel transport system substrate-binding protein